MVGAQPLRSSEAAKAAKQQAGRSGAVESGR